LVNRTLVALTMAALVWPHMTRGQEQQTVPQPEFCIERQVEGAACIEVLAREQTRNIRRLDALRLKCDDSRAGELEATTQQLAQCQAGQDRIPILEAQIQKLQQQAATEDAEKLRKQVAELENALAEEKAALAELQTAFDAVQTKNTLLTDMAESFNSLSEELNTARFEVRALNEQIAELDGQNATLRQQIINMEQEIKLAADTDMIRELIDEAACINASVADTLATDGMAKIVLPSRPSAQSVLQKLAQAKVDLTNIRLGYVDQPEGTDCPFALDIGFASLRWTGEPQDTRASLFDRSNVEAYLAAVPTDQECADLSGSEDIELGEVWVTGEQGNLQLCDLSSGRTRPSRSKDDIGYFLVEIEYLEEE